MKPTLYALAVAILRIQLLDTFLSITAYPIKAAGAEFPSVLR